MVSCLILYHHTITSLTKCFMLRAIFKEEELEIHVQGNNTVVIYLWNVKKAAVWQAALTFEMTNMMTGYGYGERKKDAEKEAQNILFKRMAMEEAPDSLQVEETPAVYTIGVAT
ncbi:hypothetical protein WMZ97_19290 [Lentibacillus sp. N15]|uniref:hypothetical protein n=1 Tax=Lentibacillus songyuanensis TaxID=3136161 RepID=UPI0031BA1521